MKRVQILLSTYNGEKYLKQQIDSILKQNYKNISVLIRDDGSSDMTVKIIEKYAKENERIHYIAGKNIGVWNSFLELINLSDDFADYYAFADQDDVWLPNKIEEAIKCLEREKQKKPALYASNLILVDENLKEYKQNKGKKVVPSIQNALVENICAGCTEVFNKKLRDILINKTPNYMIMHDWWVYLCASCLGKVIYDTNAYIYYRQHSSNEIGIKKTFLLQWCSRICRFKKMKNSLSKQAESFFEIYGEESDNCKRVKMLTEYRKNIKTRFEFATSNFFLRQNKVDNLVYRFLFLMGVL